MENTVVDQRKHHYRGNKVDTARNRIHLGKNQITGVDERAMVVTVNPEDKGEIRALRKRNRCRRQRQPNARIIPATEVKT